MAHPAVAEDDARHCSVRKRPQRTLKYAPIFFFVLSRSLVATHIYSGNHPTRARCKLQRLDLPHEAPTRSATMYFFPKSQGSSCKRSTQKRISRSANLSVITTVHFQACSDRNMIFISKCKRLGGKGMHLLTECSAVSFFSRFIGMQ